MGYYVEGKWVYDAIDEASGYGYAGTQQSASYQSRAVDEVTRLKAKLAKKDAQLSEAQRLSVQRVAEVTRERDQLKAEIERLKNAIHN